MNKKKDSTRSIQEILDESDFWNRHKQTYISKEFQDFGYRLAVKLNDLAHKSLYIKLAKTEERIYLEQALRFAIDYPNAKNKGKIFMWKLKDIKSKLNVK